tara:strand:- start:2595 stop:3041 length:447 start_codon:yes stop_codon:yes gene_type:complete
MASAAVDPRARITALFRLEQSRQNKDRTQIGTERRESLVLLALSKALIEKKPGAKANPVVEAEALVKGRRVKAVERATAQTVTKVVSGTIKGNPVAADGREDVGEHPRLRNVVLAGHSRRTSQIATKAEVVGGANYLLTRLVKFAALK